jgi:DNA-binding response OmpR family regulator
MLTGPMTDKAAGILIAEDDVAIRTMLLKVLQREGYAPQTAKDGREAIDLLALQSFDVILLDLMMPKVGGFEVIEYLERAAPEELRKCVIVLTAASNAHMKHLDETRVRKVIRKPFDMVALIATIRECLSDDSRE